MKMNNCSKHPNHDTFICQKCGQIFCSGCVGSEWRTDITGNEHAGNVCSKCILIFETFQKMEHPDKNGYVNVSKEDLIKCFC